MKTPFRIRGSHLYVEDVAAIDLARQFGTPVFVVSEGKLRDNYRMFRDTFSREWRSGPVLVLPSVKASPLIAIQQVLASEQSGADVFGAAEYEVALRGGIRPDRVSVNGSQKTAELIARAIENDSLIVIDSKAELDVCIREGTRLAKQARVMFRLKPFLDDIDRRSDYVPQFEIRHLVQMIKYGIPTSDLAPMAATVAHSPCIDLVGVHAHLGRHAKDLAVWSSWSQHIIEMAGDVAKHLPGWYPRIINVGGGFSSGPDRDTDVTVKGYSGPSLDEVAHTIAESFRRALCDAGFPTVGVTLALEPGRGIHCDTGLHLTTVRNVKYEHTNIDRAWAEVDTSQMFLGIGGDNFDSPKFDLLVANRIHESAAGCMDIVGVTCNLELLYCQQPLPPLVTGDVLALLNTGSYIESCARNFNALPRPGTVLVAGSTVDMIKRHETIDDVVARDLVPERLTQPELAAVP